MLKISHKNCAVERQYFVKVCINLGKIKHFHYFDNCIHITGPPPPPLPPPMKGMHQSNHLNTLQLNIIEQAKKNEQNNNNNVEEDEDANSDSGLEVIEEPTLRPSELVKGNHNRTMSTISGNINYYTN